jgi:hypothetical protein
LKRKEKKREDKERERKSIWIVWEIESVKRESVFMGFNKGERERGKYINLEMRLMREKSERERERERERE